MSRRTVQLSRRFSLCWPQSCKIVAPAESQPHCCLPLQWWMSTTRLRRCWNSRYLPRASRSNSAEVFWSETSAERTLRTPWTSRGRKIHRINMVGSTCSLVQMFGKTEDSKHSQSTRSRQELNVRNSVILLVLLPASTVTQHGNKGRQNTGHF